MKILVVTNMYPREDAPAKGVFVERQVRAYTSLFSEDEVRIVHIPTTACRALYAVGWFRVLLAYMRFRPQVVHVHYGLSLLLAWAIPGRRVVTFHGSDLSVAWQRRLALWFLRPHDVAIVVSSHLASLLPAGTEYVTIPCGVDVSRLREASVRVPRRDGTKVSSGRSVRVVFPASPSRPEKDYGLFSRVIDELRHRGYDVCEIRLEGLSESDVPGVLSRSDVMVLTSLHEGSPVATKEALCLGARVVSVNVGDVESQVVGLSGVRVVDSRSPAQLADAVEEVLCEEPPSSTEACRRFDVRREAESLREVYCKVIQ